MNILSIIDLFKKIFIILLSSLFAMIFMEIVVRIEESIFGILKDSTYAVSIIQRHESWHHQPTPNYKTKLKFPYGSKRGDESFYKKFTNTESCYENFDIKDNLSKDLIIIVGDSFTEGYHYDDTISSKLNNKLNISNKIAFNCSSASYAIHPIFVRLQKDIIKYNPKYYVLNIDPTDIFDDIVRYSSIADYQDDEKNIPINLNRYYSNSLTSFAEYLRRHSIIFNHLNERLNIFRIIFGTETEISDPDFINRELTYESIYSYYNEDRRTTRHIEEIKKYIEILEAFANYCDENNIKLMISIYPFREHLANYKELKEVNLFKFDYYFFNLIEKMTHQREIPLINSYFLFEKYSDNLDLVYFDGDQHFNPYGQKLWTDFVSNQILNNL